MRFTLLCASTALAASLMLSACSGGAGGGAGASAIPSGGGSTQSMGHHKITPHAVAVHPARRSPCPSSIFAACFALSTSSSGPYVEWSACFSTYSCPPTYALESFATITKTRTGGPVGRGQIAGQAWYPDPGNPTFQYIAAGRRYVAHTRARFTDATGVYYYYYPSAGTFYATFGIY
ncbi:MAG: hypothetical protein WB609_00540 [Candidatus Cybelea sp.]